jgi:glycosyltransferase involved in cell wall biosynthesis
MALPLPLPGLVGRCAEMQAPGRSAGAQEHVAPANAVVANGYPLRIAIALPGGFEFGGIGRMMMYATKGWATLEAPPRWWIIDGRGRGSVLWSPLLTLATLGHLARRRPDLLHLNVAGRGSTLRKMVMSEMAARLRIPTIVHLHDFDYAADLQRRPPWLRSRIGRMFRQARCVIVLGERDRQTVTDLLGVPPARVVVLHNAVPDPGPPPDRSGRRGPVQLLFLGHLDDRKGVPELLEALCLPALRDRDWSLVLAGGGEVGRFREVVEAKGLARRCTLTGWLAHERVYELCRAADIFILPSHAEGQAMSLLEAMAHGLAIVTTPVGAHLEAVGDDEEALIVAPGNVAQLSDALARLLADASLRGRLGAAARRKYCCRFDAEQYSRALLGIYHRALGDAPDPPSGEKLKK